MEEAEMRKDNQIRKQRRARVAPLLYAVLLFQNVGRERKCAEADREQGWSVVDIQAKGTYMEARTLYKHM